jgi:hypothetical protein
MATIELSNLPPYDGDELDGAEILPMTETDEGATEGITTLQLFENAPYNSLPSYDGDVLDGSEIVAVYEDDESTVEGVTIDQLSNNRKIGFEEFESLGGDDTGSGVYTSGFRSYIGLIPLVNANDKEFVLGRISGARGTFANGGEIRIYAENDPFDGDGLEIGSTSATVRSIEASGEARLVYFDHDGYTWIGIEYNTGGTGMNRDVRFEGRTISNSGNEDLYPKVVDFANLSNLNPYAETGNKADHTEELGKKRTYGVREIISNETTSFTVERVGGKERAVTMRLIGESTTIGGNVTSKILMGSSENDFNGGARIEGRAPQDHNSGDKPMDIDFYTTPGGSENPERRVIIKSDGDFDVLGGSKNFVIDHPNKDEYNLRHAAIEGPEAGVYQRGTIDSETVIELPDYWPDLVREDSVTVNLTPLESFQKLYVKSKSTTEIEIGIEDKPKSEIRADFTVYGERKDIDPLVVEEKK